MTEEAWWIKELRNFWGIGVVTDDTRRACLTALDEQERLKALPAAEQPYSLEQRRVCDYLQKATNGAMGCGADPIGFLIASHAALRFELDKLRKAKGVRID